MKLQLDTKAKTIKVEEDINLDELFEALRKIFPDGEWKEYKLQTNVEFKWSDPIVIPWKPYIPYNPYPWWTTQPTITYGTGTQNSSVYNIELQ